MDLIEFAVWLITEQSQIAWLITVCLSAGTAIALVFHGFPKGLLFYREGENTEYPHVINHNTFPKATVRHRESFDFKGLNKWIKANPERAFYWTAIIAAILVLFVVIWSLSRAIG